MILSFCKVKAKVILTSGTECSPIDVKVKCAHKSLQGQNLSPQSLIFQVTFEKWIQALCH